jgi:superfamily II DNA or RNA helicase
MPYSKVVISTYIFVPKSEIENINDYRHRYTVSSKYKNGPTIKYYKETDEYFGIPRHALRLTQSMADTIVDGRTIGQPVSINFKGNLWDYQYTAISTFSSLLEKGATGFFLESAPGSGKTVMGLKMMSLIGRTALIIVPKSDLVLQWKNRILEFTDLTEKDIGYVEGGKCDYEGKKVVIGLVHSVVLKRIATTQFIKNFGVIIFDECDSSLPPKTFSSASGMFPAKYRIGMTASATRADGLHIIFEESLAQFRIKCKNTKTLSPSVLLHRFSGSSGPIPSYLKDIQRRGVLITNLAKNPVRNDLIANYAFRSFNSGRITLIMSDRKDQLQKIRETLIKVYRVAPKKIGYFVRSLDGKMLKQEEKDNSAETSSIILATYGMMSRGTDIPRLETLILGTIRSDMRQTLGRIERFLEGKQAPVVIDIVDLAYKETINSAKSRIKFYQERGLQIKEIREKK